MNRFCRSVRQEGRMTNRNPFVLALCGLILIVFGYCFWINAAH